MLLGARIGIYSGDGIPYAEELEYIGCTNAWFNTGACFPTSDRYLRASMKFSYSANYANENVFMCASYETSYQTEGSFDLIASGTLGRWSFFYFGGCRFGAGAFWNAALHEYGWYYDANEVENSYSTKDGSQIAATQTIQASVAVPTDMPLKFLYRPSDETTGAFAADGRFYSARVDQLNGPESDTSTISTTIVDLIPVKDKSGNAAIYDKVSKTLIYSANSNAFTLPV